MVRSSHSPKPRWITVNQLLEEQIWLTDSALRNLIWRSADNGLSPHIRRVGRRVLIDGEGFQRWIESETKAA
jgi:hypothetical protein